MHGGMLAMYDVSREEEQGTFGLKVTIHNIQVQIQIIELLARFHFNEV